MQYDKKREHGEMCRGHVFEVKTYRELGIKYRFWYGDFTSGPTERERSHVDFCGQKGAVATPCPDDPSRWTLEECIAHAKTTIDEFIANGTIKDYS